MDREAARDGRADLLALEAHERARRPVGVDGIDEDRALGVFEVGQKLEAQGAAVENLHAVGQRAGLGNPLGHHGSEPIVGAQQVAEAQDQQARTTIHACPCGR